MIIFTEKECEYLKEFYTTETEHTSDEIQDYNAVKLKFSNSSTKYITTTNKELLEFLQDRLKEHGVKSIPKVKFMKYVKGDNLARHTDFAKYGVDIIYKTYLFQLSKGDEYGGGDLIVGKDIQNRNQGSMCIINPTTPHEVTKVTWGERISMIIFLNEEHLNLKKTII